MTIERLDKLLTTRRVTAETCVSPSTIYRLSRKGAFPKSISIGPLGMRWVESEIKTWLAEYKGADKGKMAQGWRTPESLASGWGSNHCWSRPKAPRVEQTTCSNLEAHKCVAHLLPKADVAMRMLDGLAYTRTLDAEPFKPHDRRGTRLNTFRSPGREGAAL